MTAPMIRCHCGTCEQLDRLPLRRHGIPGAFQLTFDHSRSGSGPQDDYATEMAAKMLARYGNPHGPQTPSADALPLFAGALEPTLF